MTHNSRSTSTSNTSSLLDAALSYAAQGWHVLPVHGVRAGHCTCSRAVCNESGKHPRTQHGHNDASSDPETIKAWWAKWPDANVGIATGDLSGVYVLDVDPRNGGDDSLKRLRQDHGDLPSTMRVSTGGGGDHFYFSSSRPLGCRPRLGGYAGLDFKGNGGFVVAPPSVHATGGTYSWA